MSTFEKITSILVGVLLVLILLFSYREFKEPSEQAEGSKTALRFDESLGQEFKIGPFATVVGEQSSGGPEAGCEALQPVIIAALHDIKKRLGTRDIFEVNEAALELFCQKNAEVTLADSGGNKLLLQKAPFTRAVPPQGSAEDIGTEVRINATLLPAGGLVPARPTTYGDILIPDRFLDTATSSGN